MGGGGTLILWIGRFIGAEGRQLVGEKETVQTVILAIASRHVIHIVLLPTSCIPPLRCRTLHIQIKIHLVGTKDTTPKNHHKAPSQWLSQVLSPSESTDSYLSQSSIASDFGIRIPPKLESALDPMASAF